MEKQIISTSKAPAALGPYSQAVKVENIIYTSGLLGINPETGKVPETIEEQTKQALENGKAILEEAGISMSNVVKTGVFITDMNEFSKMNEVYGTYFTEKQPARSTVEVSKLAAGAKVEIELIAII